MRPDRLALAALALAGTIFAPHAVEAAPVTSQAIVASPELPLIRTGERGAVAAGAIVGGAVGLMLGSQLGRAAAPPPAVVYAPPPPEAEVVEEEVVPVRRRVTRRVIEVEEDVAPEVEEEECVTRRTQVYDPNSGRMRLTKERSCR